MSAGDEVIRNALSMARTSANGNRMRGWGDNEFCRGMCIGQAIIAVYYLGADHLLAMGAQNELRFLARYTEGRA